MAGLIDRDELKKKAYPFPCAIGVEYAVTIRAIDEAPTVDAEPVRHGRWESDMYLDEPVTRCTACKRGFAVGHKAERFQFCPNCGAKMDAVESTEGICSVNGAQCNECIPGAPCARMDAKEES